MRAAYAVPARAIVCAVLTIVVLSITSFVSIVSQISSLRPGRGYPASGSTPRILPLDVRRAALITHKSERYHLDADDDWESLIPLGHGFVLLGPGEAYYGVSLYHQLHCLDVLRRMTTGRYTDTAARAHHTEHCLHYLRQMALCQADTTLEPARLQLLPDGRTVRQIANLTSTHECRDWVQVREWVEANYEAWEDSDDFSPAKGGYKDIV